MVEAVKESRGQLLNDLWTDGFGDRQTILKLVNDSNIDEQVVLKIARSRIAPREALAAMGRINPFFEKAGMTKYEQPARADHARLLDALHELDIEPWRLASPATLMVRIERRGPETSAWFETEMRRWVGAAFRMSKAKRDRLPLSEAIDLAREQVLSTCVYYLHRTERDLESDDATRIDAIDDDD